MSAFTRRPLSLAAGYARPSCSDCGSRDLIWSSATDLAFEVPLQERFRVVDLIGFCGPSADAWRCPDCGAWGVFDADGWL